MQFEGDWLRVSDAAPFATSRRTVQAEKTVFNLVPCDSRLECRFARWLDQGASDVLAFAKNEPVVKFSVPYVSAAGGLRSYRPDFLVHARSGMFVIETKGLETVEVTRKDRRIEQWCRNASALSGRQWRYLKVPQELFDSTPWDSLETLERGVRLTGSAD